jgi:hypothetical protein
MKKLLSVLFATLLMVGCGEEALGAPTSENKPVMTIDLDDNETRSKIIAEAIDVLKLHKGDNRLFQDLNKKMPYTGWVKMKISRIQQLVHCQDGKPHGLVTSWYANGQKHREGNLKDGKFHGPSTSWYESGQKSMVSYGDGSWIAWNENGSKQAVGNIDGSQEEWHKNGLKAAAGKKKNGKKDGLGGNGMKRETSRQI